MGAIAAIGADQASRFIRPLEWLSEPFGFLRASAEVLMPWLDANAARVAAGVSAAVAALVLVAWASAGRRAVPIAWLGLCLIAAAWGEVGLLAGDLYQGVALFALAAAAAALLGVWYPLPERQLWLRRGPSGLGGPRGAARPREYAFVGALVVAAFVTRVYALTELPSNFENEMVLSMLASQTWEGIELHVPWGMLSNTNGFLHMFLQLLTAEIFGKSVFSLRLTGAIWWTLSVPLFYWLLRRMLGVGAAIIGVMLLISAPEQLFWSRSETVCIALLTPLAVVTAALAVRLINDARFWGVLAVVLWLPLTRYAYTPAVVLPFFLVLVYLHSLVCVRGTLRRALCVIPALVVGIGLWVGSLSLAYGLFTGADWTFMNPVSSGGVAVWRGEGSWRTEGAAALAANQVRNVAANLEEVGARMTYRAAYDNWYRRADPAAHPTIINAGLPVILAVSLGYLLGQLRDPRAFAILAWIGMGLLPAVMSQDPASRRMGLAFPGFYAAIAVTLAAALDFFEKRTGHLVAWLARVVVGLGVAFVAWISMGSHFLLPTAPTYFDQTRQASAGLFADSDAVFHTLAPVWGEILALVHGDEVFDNERVPCLKKIDRANFLATALRPACDYEETEFAFTLSPERREALRSSYDPQRVSFLIGETALDKPLRELAKALFPAAQSSLPAVPSTSFNVLWLEVDRPMIDALHRPELATDLSPAEAQALSGRLLADTRLDPVARQGAAAIVVDAGLLVDEDGWYAIGLEPACDAASLSVANRPQSNEPLLPLTKGAHSLTLTLPSASACGLPLRLTMSRFNGAATVPLPSPALLAPRIASVPQAQGRRLMTDPGFKEAPLPFAQSDPPLDVGIDGRGALVILTEEAGALRIKRIGVDGNQDVAWRIEDVRPKGMSVAPDGTVFLVYAERVTVYSPDGVLMETWTEPLVRTQDLGHLASGHVLSAVVDQHVIALLDRKGRVLQKWHAFEGGPGAFSGPVSVAVSPDGNIVVIEIDGTALLFRTPADRFAPAFVGTFDALSHESAYALGWALDSRHRLILPDPVVAKTLLYDVDGARVMAADPRYDLSNLVASSVRRVVATKEGVYTLDISGRLRRFVHVSEIPQA